MSRFLAAAASAQPRIAPRTAPTSTMLSGYSIQGHRRRWYSSTAPLLDADDGPATKPKSAEEAAEALRDRQIRQAAAQEYNRRRAAYRRQLTVLRREYMNEYQRNKAADDAKEARDGAERSRQALERRRTKNVRIAENALRQEELRRQQHLAHLDHLELMQERREARQEELTKAKQLVVDELEEEAPLWLTTPEEVEAAFTHESEQLLWARPGGHVGVARPSLDAHFWKYQSHIWEMDKTYKLRRQYLLEEIEEKMYWEANIDKSIWTPEFVAEQQAIERKAKLRAMVRNAGLRALLERQRDALLDANKTELGEANKDPPVPSLAILANVRAQEEAGSQILLNDPTKFFQFENNVSTPTDDTDSDAEASSSLGVPIELVDPVRTGRPQNRVFPRVTAIDPKITVASRAQRKRLDQERKMRAAAKREEDDSVEDAAEGELATITPLDYDKMDLTTEEDEIWLKGFDPQDREEMAKVPREFRYSEEDIQWVEEQLNDRAKRISDTVVVDVENALDDIREKDKSKGQRSFKTDRELLIEKVQKERFETDQTVLDEDISEELNGLGIETEKLDTLLSSLSETQIFKLMEIGVGDLLVEDTDDGKGGRKRTDGKKKKKKEPLEKALKKVPGLSNSDISMLIEIDNKIRDAYADGE